MAEKLTPEEDAELRRLAYFERFGFELAPPMQEVKESIRARDLRAEVREPEDAATPADDEPDGEPGADTDSEPDDLEPPARAMNA